MEESLKETIKKADDKILFQMQSYIRTIISELGNPYKWEDYNIRKEKRHEYSKILQLIDDEILDRILHGGGMDV